MQYLLDTHVLLWWLMSPERILAKTKKIIANKKNKIFVSGASFWEMSIKKSIGKLEIPNNIVDTVQFDGFELLHITARECISIGDLPLLHRDPFDRMLIIQAKLNDLVLITKDEKIKKYQLPYIDA